MSKHITSAQAAHSVGGIYDLVLIASNRVRELRHANGVPRVQPQQTDISTVLLEVEQGLTGREYLDRDIPLLDSRDRAR